MTTSTAHSRSALLAELQGIFWIYANDIERFTQIFLEIQMLRFEAAVREIHPHKHNLHYAIEQSHHDGAETTVANLEGVFFCVRVPADELLVDVAAIHRFLLSDAMPDTQQIDHSMS
ncbi:hypothetical protein [Pseudomonas boanensis]|uniref:hypothetical protein n=1 Tax=Metapseudomonas boanensis TaxID=2822138 RepID=UPI0035D45ED9